MKKAILFVFMLAILSPGIAASQTAKDQSPFGIQFSGFVTANMAYDSRQTVSAREGALMLYPAAVTPDILGSDINAQPSFNILSVFSRLSGKITGPDAFGATTSGVLEGDFFGQTNGDVNGFRLRHAALNMRWKNTSLLLGQYWSPLFVLDVFPGVIALSAGAPFQPFSRNPQIRVEYEGHGVKLIAAALTQRDFTSPGPSGGSSAYLRNAARPDLHLQFQFPGSFGLFGLGGQLKSLCPEMVTSSGYKTDACITSFTGITYFKVNTGMVTVKAEALYGGNMTDHLMLGGYAVSGTDSVTGVHTYTSVNALSGWVDLSVGKALQGGLFVGYTENKGADSPLTGPVYARGANMHAVARIAPRIQFQHGHSKLAFETEWTSAYYGVPDESGKVPEHEQVTNLRFLFASYYYF